MDSEWFSIIAVTTTSLRLLLLVSLVFLNKSGCFSMAALSWVAEIARNLCDPLLRMGTTVSENKKQTKNSWNQNTFQWQINFFFWKSLNQTTFLCKIHVFKKVVKSPGKIWSECSNNWFIVVGTLQEKKRINQFQ